MIQRRDFQDYIARKTREFGDKFDHSNLPHQFVAWYESGERIKVRNSFGEIKFGTVGVTTGWRPCFILLYGCRSMGSSEVLNSRCEVLAYKPNQNPRKYIPCL